MSDPIPRILDSLAVLSRELLASASEGQWQQIEAVEREREPADRVPRRESELPSERGSPERSAPERGPFEASRGGQGERRDLRPAALGGLEPSNRQRSEAPGRGEEARTADRLLSRPATPEVALLPPAGIGTGRNAPPISASPVSAMPVSSLAPASGSHPHAVALPGEPGAGRLPASAAIREGWTGPRASGPSPAQPQPQTVAAHAVRADGPVPIAPVRPFDAATARIELTLEKGGPHLAAQALHAHVRSLPPAAASGFLDAARPVVAEILHRALDPRTLDPAARGPAAADRTQPVAALSGEARASLALAHVAGAVEHESRSPSAPRTAEDIGRLVLSLADRRDEFLFAGLAHGVGAGAGARLALGIASLLDREDGNGRRGRALASLLAGGFRRIGARAADARAALFAHMGPLVVEWAALRGADAGEALAALLDQISADPRLLPEFGTRLDRLEKIGLESLRALRDLAGTREPGLALVRAELLASDDVFHAISASEAALAEIRIWSLAGREPADEGPALEAVRIVLGDIGFEASRLDFLVERVRLGDGNMLGASWTEIEDFELIRTQGRAFQRLLAFLDGRYVVPVDPQRIDFADV